MFSLFQFERLYSRQQSCLLLPEAEGDENTKQAVGYPLPHTFPSVWERKFTPEINEKMRTCLGFENLCQTFSAFFVYSWTNVTNKHLPPVCCVIPAVTMKSRNVLWYEKHLYDIEDNLRIFQPAAGKKLWEFTYLCSPLLPERKRAERFYFIHTFRE